MEHTALVMAPAVDYVIVHELAHKWWFGLVGDDQARSPWLDEAFATYAEEAARGQRPWCRRARLGRQAWRRAASTSVRSRPIDYGTVYFAGACLLDRLERRIGPRTFRAALRDYAVAHRYGWSTGAAFARGDGRCALRGRSAPSGAASALSRRSCARGGAGRAL